MLVITTYLVLCEHSFKENEQFFYNQFFLSFGQASPYMFELFHCHQWGVFIRCWGQFKKFFANWIWWNCLFIDNITNWRGWLLLKIVGNGCQWVANWQQQWVLVAMGRWHQMRLWLDLVFACSRLEETVGRGSHQRSHCALHPHTNTDTNTVTNKDTNLIPIQYKYRYICP